MRERRHDQRRGGRRGPVTPLTQALPRPAVEALEGRHLLIASLEVTDLSSGIAIIDGDTTPAVEDGTDFGVNPIGTARPFHGFRVANTSATDTLTLGGAAVPAGFRVERDLPAALAPGESAVFAVSLLDDAQAPRAGDVRFPTNVPGAETFNFAVGGAFVAASPEPDNIFEDVTDFTDADSVSFQGGVDPDGIPIDVPVTRLLRFNVPAGQAVVAFSMNASLGINEGATADAELLVIRDADEDQELDVAERAAPVTNLLAPPDGSDQSKSVTLNAGTYFAFLRTANFAVTDGTVERPGARLDYTLGATITAVVAPDVAVTFAGTAVPDGDTSPSPDEGTNFGAAQVGQPAPQRTFTVTNTGNETLQLGEVQVGGPFQLVTDLPESLAAGASASFVVAMATATTGDKAGGVSFSTNVSSKDPYNFSLAGAVTDQPPGAAPEVSVSIEGSGAALADGQAATVEFGSSAQGQAGATRRFIVRNDGNAPLALGTVSVPAGFTVSEPLVAALAPGESDGFTVTLDTSTIGERTGTLNIPTSDADEDPFNFNVRGVVGLPGSSAGADITVLLDDAALASGQAVDFGTGVVGTPGPERTLTLRNDGTSPLDLGALELPAGYAMIAGPAQTTLAPGASTTVRIGLATATVGTFAGPLTIASNDPDESPFTLDLLGVVAAEAAVPPTLDVGNVTGRVPAVVIAGTRAARGSVAFTVTNTTTAALAAPVTFAALASSDGQHVPLVSVTRNLKLKAGQSRVMRLKFAFPANVPEGDKNVLVTAETAGRVSDTAAGPQVSVQEPFVRLTGLPSATPLARPLTFGKRAAFPVPLQNAGNVPTSRTPATYTLIVTRDGTEATQAFTTTATGRINLKPNASRPQRVAVTFPPGSFAAGSYTLIVRLNAVLNETNGATVALIPFTIA